MFSQVLTSLSRLIPRSPQIVVTQPDGERDSSWHNSSHELAQGLQVTEVDWEADDVLPVFADTLPAWYPPRESGRGA